MKLRGNWTRIAQCVLTLVCALSLKSFYSTASADQLRWILAPTAALVELVSGVSFEFESRAGYLSSDRSFLIASSCAGVNFLITAFLMLTLRRIVRDHSQHRYWGLIPAALVFAYLVTLVANTTRIAIALRLQPMSDQLHRLEGIVVYFGFLLLLFVISEKLESEKPSWLFPLVVYYAMMLGIPLANGAWRTNIEFWEYSFYILLIPLLLVLPLAAFRIYGRL
jgi:exosortase K